MAPTGAAPTSTPPLPDLTALVRSSTRLAEVPGLTEQARRWQRDARAARADVAVDARRLASPRLWPDTLASLASTGWRVLSAAAPTIFNPFLSLGNKVCSAWILSWIWNSSQEFTFSLEKFLSEFCERKSLEHFFKSS